MATAREYIVHGTLVNETKTRQFISGGVLFNQVIEAAGGGNAPTGNISGPLTGSLGGPI